ncbi:MAG: uracil phosphoribosyltransferase [Bacteroidota bacterium]
MLKVLDHPLITHKLSLLRNKETRTKDFRQNLEEISGLMAYEITRDLPMSDIEVETPVGMCKTQELVKEIILVPILRAGLGMVGGITHLIPIAKVGHIGLYRNEQTLEPVSYYSKFPQNLTDAVVMILDPMLATGGSASAAISNLKNKGAGIIKLVSIVGAPEGVGRIEKDHPDVEIVLAALDERLNGYGYIVPGLGDAGDRIFGTK